MSFSFGFNSKLVVMSQNVYTLYTAIKTNEYLNAIAIYCNAKKHFLILYI